MNLTLPWILGLLAFGYLMLLGIRYLLGARMYLTCALTEMRARAVPREAIDPGALELLALFDAELAAANFRHLGYGQVTPFITYHGTPAPVSVFANEQMPAYAIMRPRLAAEYGRLVDLEIRTEFAAGNALATANRPEHDNLFAGAASGIESQPDLSVAELVARHRERIAAERAKSDPLGRTTLDDGLAVLTAQAAGWRRSLREKGWARPTTNPRLDRFTLRGALALTHFSIRVYRKRKAPRPVAAPALSEDSSRLRIEAELNAVLHVADNPEPAPGARWTLLLIIGATALFSFVAMAILWNVLIATLILAAIAFHEAGHALAMRRFGYRDVHVFFVPLLGALTVGRPAVTTPRQRIGVLLAGPLPGLWLGVLLLALQRFLLPFPSLRAAAFVLLFLNGLNLLPLTPFDGGRVVESLTRPESHWRLWVHALSVVGLLALAAFLQDPLIGVIGFAWATLLPGQLRGWRLRQSVRAALGDRSDYRSVVRAALETMSAPSYARWGTAMRQTMARAFARQFAEAPATPADRRWGIIAYVSAWVPVVIGYMLWKR